MFLITLSAFILDLIIGDPEFILHPVVIIGKLIALTEKAARKILNNIKSIENQKRLLEISGFLIVIINSAAAILTAYVLKRIIYIPGKTAGLIFESLLISQMIAAKGLRQESMKVYKALKSSESDALKAARKQVARIVGRDTEKLSKEGVVRATVETVAENFSDGVTAPVLFSLAGGIYGIYFYKAVNTMDSMIGYKDEKYKEIGRCAARLDDLLNFIPSRISAFLMLCAGCLLRLNIKNGIKVFFRDRYKHASPNSAQTEAAAAGLLGIELAGDAYYFGKLYKKQIIGTPLREIEAEDIRRINDLVLLSGILGFIIGGAIWYIL